MPHQQRESTELARDIQDCWDFWIQLVLTRLSERRLAAEQAAILLEDMVWLAGI